MTVTVDGGHGKKLMLLQHGQTWLSNDSIVSDK
jgi:hypothetical protein